VVVKLELVPDDGFPPVAVHAKVYAVVPPEPVAVKVTAVPIVPVAGPDMVTVRGKPAIVTVADAVAVLAGDSLSVRTTLIALDPFTE
jgi:hypothetical protein